MAKTDSAIVIGSGLGGMATALRLRALGLEVTLLEKLPDLGGRARTFKQDGYSFDAGPTVITAPYLLDELFRLFGKSREDYFSLTPVHPWYRLAFWDGAQFDYCGDVAFMEEQIGRLCQKDIAGYREYFKLLKEIYRIGYDELGAVPFHSLPLMLKLLPTMLRLRCMKSCYSLVSEFIQNEKTRRALSFHSLLIGGNPFKTPAIYSLIQVLERKFGVHYAIGGTNSIVRSLEALLSEVGVSVVKNFEVKKLVVKNGKVDSVESTDGERLSADLFVSNGDPGHCYNNLIGSENLPWTARANFRRMKYSMSLFVVYFGSKKLYSDLPHHTIYFAESYKELLHDLFEAKRMPDEFSYYLHAPTRTDSSVAPAGRENFYSLFPVPNLKSHFQWEGSELSFRDRLIEYMDNSLVPGLSENIDTIHHISPRYFEQELLSPYGAGFSIQPKLTQSAYFRFHNQCPVYDNLLFCGAGVHPGAGIPGVLNSAKVVEAIAIDKVHASQQIFTTQATSVLHEGKMEA